MKQSLLLFVGVLVICSLSTGCDTDNSTTITIPFVDQEFVLELWENLDPNASSPLQINISTIANEQCLNSTILSDTNLENQTLTVTLYDILDPENCLPGEAPARGEQAVENLAESEAYVFNIALKDVVTNTGELVVRPNSFEVRMSAATGISWVHTVLNRIPENAIWGFITYTGDEQLARAQAWVDDLAAISNPLELDPGNYGYFAIDDAMPSVRVSNTPEGIDMLTFVYKYNGQVSELDVAVTDLETDLPDDMVYGLWDDKGREW